MGTLIIKPKYWTPIRLNPSLWLDANDSSTITTVSGAVSEWRDKSGNNRHATQGTAGNRPLLVANGLNGTGVIRFTQDDLVVPNLLLTGNNIDVFVVASIQSSSNTFGRLLSVRQTGQSDDWNSSTGWVVIARNSSEQAIMTQQNFSSNSFSVQWGQVYLLHSQLNPSQLVLRANTNIVATKNGTTPINSTDGLRIGQSLNTGYDENWDGDIAQIIMFDRVLTQIEREQIEGYLAWQTGLTTNLPNEHPFKNKRPRG